MYDKNVQVKRNTVSTFFSEKSTKIYFLLSTFLQFYKRSAILNFSQHLRRFINKLLDRKTTFQGIERRYF